MGPSVTRWWLLLPLSGCAFISDEHEAWRLDPDGDGIGLEEDCDNQDAAIGAPLTWHLDLDGDGHGDPANTVDACVRPDNAVTSTDDCWDNPDEIPAAFVALNGLPQPSAAEVYPGAPNALYDGVNQSCLDAADFTAALEFDGDGDGYLVAGYADRDGNTGDDCVDGADTDAANPAGLDPALINPAAAEVWYDGTDADCDSNDCDADGDSYDGGEDSAFCSPVDCDDTDSSIQPDASVDEIFYNGIDDNCDLAADQDGDADGDGYWADDYETRVTSAGGVPLDIPSGASGDCWDDPSSTPTAYTPINGFPALSAAAVSPVAAETWYDGIDADCAGDDDFDADGDGYAYSDTSYPNRSGRVGEDCFDAEGQPKAFSNPASLLPALVNPSSIEVWYDGTDANCDGNDDDQDLDGHGAEAAGGDDCDDLDRTIYRGAPVVCYDDILDNDCDGQPDAACELADMDLGDAHITLSGKSSAMELGASALWADLDGDGMDDAVVSSTAQDRVYVFASLTPDTTDRTTGSADAQVAISASSSLGTALASTDVDGDGYADLWVGAQASTYATTGGGVAMMFYGPLSGTITAADVYLYPRASSSSFGAALAISADGDLLVGASGDDTLTTNGGAAYLFMGPVTSSTSTVYADAARIGSDTEGAAGRALAWADLNGDGDDDALIAAADSTYSYSDDGEVFISYGPLTSGTSALINADARLRGASAYDHLGQGIFPVGDVNGDGYDDAWITSQGATASTAWVDGGAMLLHGQASDLSSGLLSSIAVATLKASVSAERLGSALSGAGDLDDDGTDDLIVGASQRGSATGAAYIFYGPLSGSYTSSGADITFQGETSADEAGTAIAAGGDANGDGVPDMIITAPGQDASATSGGAAYVVFGPRY